MKNTMNILILALTITFSMNAQQTRTAEKKSEATVVTLEQTSGEFTQKTLRLKEGSYIFEIENNNVGHKVGFVLAPKSNPKAHIKEAYVTKAVKNNTTESSNITTLEKGEYVYFCPLNPTPEYILIVE